MVESFSRAPRRPDEHPSSSFADVIFARERGRGQRRISAMQTAISIPTSWSDEDIVGRVLSGDRRMFEAIMRRHNTRIFRAARAITGNDHEAEDVMQHAYVRAYEHLSDFQGHASFSTWLTRIAVYEALARVRYRQRFSALESH